MWLGSTVGTVVSWSDTQILATVTCNATSGTVRVQQSRVWSNSQAFTVSTPKIDTISPDNGLPGVTSVTITGSGFGAAQGTGQVWLGTLNGVVQSWTDTQVVAKVATGSASGYARILQGCVMSNAVAFTMNGLHITSISPTSGTPGASVTITGAGFGSAQGSGTVMVGSANGVNVTWTDTQITATVAATSLTGVVRVQQNGAWSNALGFTVPVAGGNTLVPNLLNLVVGDTRTLQALSATGQTQTGLTWTSSDPTTVSLSTEDPPLLTALAAGHVTITAGTATSDVTVSAGALSLGTVLWSNPGNGSGVYGIWPAVPSSSGVADVFAFQRDGTVQAVTSDGTTAWTVPVSEAPDWQGAIDFQGGIVVFDRSQDDGGITSITKLDGIDGHRYPAFTPEEHTWLPMERGIHPDGTIFVIERQDRGATTSVIGINPITGTKKFSVPLVGMGQTLESQTVAGDGYFYLAYRNSTIVSLNIVRDDLILLRVDSSGVYNNIPIQSWPDDLNRGVQVITNADQGVLVIWNSFWDHGMAMVTGTAVSLLDSPRGGDVSAALQRADGSYIGVSDDDSRSMIAFDAMGKLLWSVAGDYYPLIATADGGVIASDEFGAAITFDQNGNATGQLGDLPTYSWLWNAYEVGSVKQVKAWLSNVADSFGAFFGGNHSGNGTAAREKFAPLKSCPGAATPCPQEAIMSALGQLKVLLQSPCQECDNWVFSILPGKSKADFLKYLSRPPRFWDGTRSYAPANEALCPSGFWNQLNCQYGGGPVRNELGNSDAKSQTPVDQGKGAQIFFNPPQGICNVLVSQNPSPGDKGVMNQALLFHEALHGYTGLVDTGLQSIFKAKDPTIVVNLQNSANITDYLQDHVIPQGAFGARTCGN